MKVSEAKQICRDFTPVKKNGKTGCKYKVGDDMCSHKRHFRCELVVFQEKQAEAETASAYDVVGDKQKLKVASASRVGILEKCPRLYYLNYILRVKPPYKARWKIVGTAFGDERANIDQGLIWNLGKYDLQPIERAKLRAVLRRYEDFVAPKIPEIVAEGEVKFDFNGTMYIGYIDGETLDSKTLYEWKYAAQTYDKLRIARQASVYFQGRPKAQEIILGVAKKGTHKPKKAAKQKKTPKATKKNPDPQPFPVPQAETIEEFEERVYEATTEESFQMTTFRRKDFNTEQILTQMNKSFALLPAIEEADFPPAYSIECDMCEYRYLCEAHLDRDIGCTKKICSSRDMCTQIDQGRKSLERRALAKANRR